MTTNNQQRTPLVATPGPRLVGTLETSSGLEWDGWLKESNDFDFSDLPDGSHPVYLLPVDYIRRVEQLKSVALRYLDSRANDYHADRHCKRGEPCSCGIEESFQREFRAALDDMGDTQ